MKPLNVPITESQGKLLRKSFPHRFTKFYFFLQKVPYGNKEVVIPYCLSNKQDTVPSGKMFSSRPCNVSYIYLVHLLYTVSVLVVVTSHCLNTLIMAHVIYQNPLRTF